MQLWDTAGQERFRALIPSYVRDADACLIVIDVSLRSSLDGVDKWLDFVRESRGQDAMIFLVGNKSDIAEREVTKKEVEEYAEKNRYPYIEVSAKSGSNIALLFRKISERLIESKNGTVKEASQTAASEKDTGSKAPQKNEGGGNIELNKKSVNEDTSKKQCEC